MPYVGRSPETAASTLTAVEPKFIAVSSDFTVSSNKKYIVDTSSNVVTITLPLDREIGDSIEVVDAEATWEINNLTIASQGGDKFKDFSGIVDSPLICDVGGATLLLIWEGDNWRLIA